MARDIVVPSLGESVSEATVATWLKGVGEAVGADQPLVELETDKVTVEVNAPAAGTIKEIVAPSGTDVKVGALLCRFEEGGTATVAPASAPSPAPTATVKPVAPAARKLMHGKGLTPAQVEGSGKHGTVLKEDVLKSAAPAPAPPPVSTSSREERVKMTRLRKRIAERLKEAQTTAAMLTTFNEADMQPVMDLRAQYQDAFTKKHGVKLGFMSFFVKAAVQALKEWPSVNAEIDGDDIVYKNHYDIGVAVGTPQGLVVPVLRDADAMSFAGVESAIVHLAQRARDGKLSMEDMTGGTFTITNGGVYGSLLSTPILNRPQSGILGLHKIQQRPVVTPDGAIVARPMMYLALSYDHRIIDGREAVSFLVRVKENIEDPARLLFEV